VDETTTEIDLHGTTDAMVWAEAFVATVNKYPEREIPTDAGTMVGWFANAMMAERDARDAPLSGHPVGALKTLLDALERRRVLFWTGDVLVEIDAGVHPPNGQATMVLDRDDMNALKRLADA
jgi:hypothetical protein